MSLCRIGGKLAISDLELSNKRVLIRTDFNVPLNSQQEIQNSQRIDETIPTIKYALDKGARAVILMSHLGRPNGNVVSTMSLLPVAKKLEEILGRPVLFLDNCVGEHVEKACQEANQGAVILLENLRFHLEEEGSGTCQGQKVKAKPADIDAFRASLSRLGDVYINDAFGTAHRAHSSMVGIQLAQRAAGFLMKKELDYFTKVMESPQRPYLAILGGSKVSDKICIIKNLLNHVDEMIIGGGMSFTFKKVLLQMEIGSSLFDRDGANLVQEIVNEAKAKNVQLHFPIDYITANEFKENAKVGAADDESGGIPVGSMGLDVGPRSIEHFRNVVNRSRTIMWNGPLGVFEWENFSRGTHEILKTVIEVTKHGVVTVIGGGDTASAAVKWDLQDGVSHVSTGGGASLELLEGKAMPGIEALSIKT